MIGNGDIFRAGLAGFSSSLRLLFFSHEGVFLFPDPGLLFGKFDGLWGIVGPEFSETKKIV